jgi:hypothetical protein
MLISSACHWEVIFYTNAMLYFGLYTISVLQDELSFKQIMNMGQPYHKKYTGHKNEPFNAEET